MLTYGPEHFLDLNQERNAYMHLWLKMYHKSTRNKKEFI